jgi:hypothetical protein
MKKVDYCAVCEVCGKLMRRIKGEFVCSHCGTRVSALDDFTSLDEYSVVKPHTPYEGKICRIPPENFNVDINEDLE